MSISVPDPPRASSVEVTDDSLVVYLTDGRSVSAPLEWFPRLRKASPHDRKNWRLIGKGIGIQWETLDEDISVQGLLTPASPGRARQTA